MQKRTSLVSKGTTWLSYTVRESKAEGSAIELSEFRSCASETLSGSLSKWLRLQYPLMVTTILMSKSDLVKRSDARCIRKSYRCSRKHLPVQRCNNRPRCRLEKWSPRHIRQVDIRLVVALSYHTKRLRYDCRFWRVCISWSWRADTQFVLNKSEQGVKSYSGNRRVPADRRESGTPPIKTGQSP